MTAAVISFAAARAALPPRFRIGDMVRLRASPSLIGTVIGGLTDGRVIVSWGLWSRNYAPGDLTRIFP